LEANQIIINRQSIPWPNLAQVLSVSLQHSVKKRVVVRPGQGVVHGDVVRVMDTAKQCGAKKLVIWGANP
jgi:biopolymer transport protein ExbD